MVAHQLSSDLRQLGASSRRVYAQGKLALQAPERMYNTRTYLKMVDRINMRTYKLVHKLCIPPPYSKVGREMTTPRTHDDPDGRGGFLQLEPVIADRQILR